MTLEEKRKELNSAIMETLLGYSVKEAQGGMRRLRNAAHDYFSEYEKNGQITVHTQIEERHKSRKKQVEDRYERIRLQDYET